MAEKKLTRRDFLKLSTATAAGAALANVAIPDSGRAQITSKALADKIELVEWAFAENRIAWQQAVMDKFVKDKNPNVTLRIENIPYKDIWDKLQAVFVAGSGAPDMADLAIHVWRKFTRGTVPMYELDDRIGKEKDNLIEGSALDPWRANGKTYAVGNEVNTVLMYYREDLLKEMGLDGAAPKTWGELAAMGEKIVTAKHKLMALPDNSSDYLEQMLVQRGGGFFDEKDQPIANSDLAVDTLQFQQTLVKGVGMLSPGGDPYQTAYYAAMNEGAFVFQIGAPWYQGFMKDHVPDLKGKWRIRLLPAWDKGTSHASVQHGGTGMGITKQVQKNGLEPAWELIRICNLTKEGALLGFELQNLVPTYKAAWDDPRFQSGKDPYFGDQVPAEWTIKAAKDMVVAYSIPDWQTMVDALVRVAIAPVLVQGADPKKALDAAVAEFSSQR